VIRAAAFKTGFQPSNVDTKTYIFLSDVIRQSPNNEVPAGWPSTWGANVVDYGMDPNVVNNALYSGTIINDMQTIPSFRSSPICRTSSIPQTVFTRTRAVTVSLGTPGLHRTDLS
jgi:hypothetical protein